jgi:hypothetical protein
MARSAMDGAVNRVAKAKREVTSQPEKEMSGRALPAQPAELMTDDR